MQRVITEDVLRADGDVRWTAGTILDYPAGTWRQIARSLKRALDSFARPVEEAARDIVASAEKPAGGKKRR